MGGRGLEGVGQRVGTDAIGRSSVSAELQLAAEPEEHERGDRKNEQTVGKREQATEHRGGDTDNGRRGDRTIFEIPLAAALDFGGQQGDGGRLVERVEESGCEQQRATAREAVQRQLNRVGVGVSEMWTATGSKSTAASSESRVVRSSSVGGRVSRSDSDSRGPTAAIDRNSRTAATTNHHGSTLACSGTA